MNSTTAQPHIHPGLPGIATSLQARKKINTLALTEVFTSAAEIAKKVQAENINSGPMPAYPSNSQLAQNANCLHQCRHPQDPKDLDFDIAEDFLPPGFFKKDVHVNGRCHILCATDKMIDILSKAKHWFIDAAFKVVC